MLMDPSLMQVDCRLQKAEEKISPADICDTKNVLLQEDDKRQSSCYQLNGNNNSQLVSDLPQGPTEKKEDPISFVDDCHRLDDGKVENFEQLNNDPQGCTEKVEDDFRSDYEDKVNHLPSEVHLPSNLQLRESGGSLKNKIVVETVDRLCESNENALSSQSQQMRAGPDDVDAKGKEDSPSASDSGAAHEGKYCTLQDLSELACRIELEPDKCSNQGENETYVPTVNTTEPNLQEKGSTGNDNNQGEELDLSGNVEQEHAIALWVKWRGKWQTGIHCPRDDCPLSTLKSKPTHERKRYIVVFFPRTRTYHWVDMLLIRPIQEYPVPLVNGTHRKWRKLVKDLSVPRRYIMHKLAMAMLNFSDQLHTEAVVENARKATTWKEFALEASRCGGYADLGKMLIKLENMILPEYISSNWVQSFFNSWIQRCQSAKNAESIELLTEPGTNAICALEEG